MRAVIWTGYGSPEVLQLGQIEQPVPKDDEVRVKVHAATVTLGDCELRSSRLPRWIMVPMRLYIGARKPKRITILGQELAGEVEATGTSVQQFRPGDQVFGYTGLSFGAYAEYCCVPAALLTAKSEQVPYGEAAAIATGGGNALHFLRLAKISLGERVLVNGACGSIGTCAIQLAKNYGAEVTAVDSADKLGLARALGADHVIDYARQDFASVRGHYDVIFDIVGRSRFAASLRALRRNGRYLLGNPKPSHMVRGWWVSRLSRKRVIFAFADQSSADLADLSQLVEAGTLRVVIDKRYPLQHTAEAHAYVDSGAKQGNVVIDVVAEAG